MKYLLLLVAAATLTGVATLIFQGEPEISAAPLPKPGDLIVHEWGTFTTIAGKDGVAIDWRPLGGPSDLPSFVYNEANKDGFRGTYGVSGKSEISRVRMETPVIYFYTKETMDVSVSVGFPKGKITEWYPQASVVNSAIGTGGGYRQFGQTREGINWGTIKLLPNEKPNYMREAAYSHYYPARETDSVPIQVCNADKTRVEKEKFLFYRGIGNFDLPIKAKMDGNKLTLGTTEDKYGPKSNPGRTITNAILFENQGGRVGFRMVGSISGDTPVTRPELTSTLADIYAELERVLIGQGLYEKEAKAMIETWKDSWFEEGLRVFYILPRMTTDEVLPLNIEPRPKEIVRVLVGRAEILTPEMKQDVRGQVIQLRSRSASVRRSATESLKARGRFYEPILKELLETEHDQRIKAQIKLLVRDI